jgi:PAS domain S-box-containing protein
MIEDDGLLFNDDESDESDELAPLASDLPAWKLLIVDDDPEVHQITKLSLVNFKFEDRGLQFLQAYSADEALAIIQSTPDIALTLLDVVMETEHAGLELVEKIRTQLNNNRIRIILRTGQPGVAPERDIIAHYDINDYAEKAELSAQKLFTIVVASLRAYRDIVKLEDSRAELLEANQHLSKERERIQVTLDSIGDAVMTTDAAGLITHLNPVAERLTGWSLQDAKGMDVKTVFPIVDASTGETIDNPIDKVIATGETVYLSNHTTLISRTGQQFQIADSAAPIRDVNKHILGMVLTFNDVTEQYRLREAAKQSQLYLQMIMDHTPAIIYAKDLLGRYLFINQKFKTFFNLTTEEIIGKTDYEIFPAEIAAEFCANDKLVLYSGKALEAEETAPYNDEIRHYLSVKFPIVDDSGDAYAICGISTDITEHKKQEEQLRRSQKMEAIGQLTGGIAHDFNNQLGVVIGYLDFINDFIGDNPKPAKWVDIAINAALRCTDLTRQLLAFSRTQNNIKTTVNINLKLEELKNMFARSITPAIEVQYFLSDDLWLTETDGGEFQDAILNLVINARDAMPHGGKLLIESTNKTIAPEYAAINSDVKVGDFVQIMLSDTGMGMDKDTRDHIFEPFFTTKPKGKGTGLGMAMVYGFVKRYDGFIQIHSELDVGTTMRLHLPRSFKSEPENTLVLDEQGVIPCGTETVLIVDDEVDLLHLADSYLSALGYQTLLAENAQQAMDMIEKQPDIDLLFSDVVMPGGTNGYELAEQVTEKYPHIKVLLSSGFTTKTMSQNVQQRFKAEILNKPYRKIELARSLRKILSKSDSSHKD